MSDRNTYCCMRIVGIYLDLAYFMSVQIISLREICELWIWMMPTSIEFTYLYLCANNVSRLSSLLFRSNTFSRTFVITNQMGSWTMSIIIILISTGICTEETEIVQRQLCCFFQNICWRHHRLRSKHVAVGPVRLHIK